MCKALLQLRIRGVQHVKNQTEMRMTIQMHKIRLKSQLNRYITGISTNHYSPKRYQFKAP
jgi:hypothetical protein